MKLPNDKQQAFSTIKAVSTSIIKLNLSENCGSFKTNTYKTPQPSGVVTFKLQQLLDDIQHIYTIRRSIQETDQNILPPQYLQRAATKQNKSLELFLKRNKEIIQKSKQEMKENQINE